MPQDKIQAYRPFAWRRAIPTRRLLSVLAPASRQKANTRPPALIEDRLPLPCRFLLSDPARLDVSHSAVLAALGKLGIATDGGHNGHTAKGQIPFGWNFQGRAS